MTSANKMELTSNRAIFVAVHEYVAGPKRTSREARSFMGKQTYRTYEYSPWLTSAPEALALHDKMAKDLWQRALKGAAAVRFMRDLIERQAR